MSSDARSARIEVDVTEITGFWLRGGQYLEAADSAGLAEAVVQGEGGEVALGTAFDVVVWQPGLDIRQARRVLLRAEDVIGIAVGPVVH
jgi:hypothetical protein